MGTYLLTWNPRRWAWDDYSVESANVEAGKTVRRTWSTGNRRELPVGSRVFLLRQGQQPLGIMASGVVVGELVDLPHYEPERAARGDTAPRVLVEFDALLDVAQQSPLLRERLEEPRFSGMNWNVQASGSEIPAEVASVLEAAWAEHRGKTIEPHFVVGALYTRFDILAMLGMPVQRGGDPFTGYFRRENSFYLFPTVGNAGATGHDYHNEWESDDVLRWFTKTGTSRQSPSVDAMLSPNATVHLFTRTEGRNPFKYEGRVRALDADNESPARIRWRLTSHLPRANRLHLVNVEYEVRDNLRLFASAAPLSHDRASLVARQTIYWVYDPDTGAFGPSKFLGYSGMTFDRYERASAGDFVGSRFDGQLTRKAISEACGAEYIADPSLAAKLGDWLNSVFGLEGPKPRADVVFLSMSPGVDNAEEDSATFGIEGKFRSVMLSVRERDPKARAACLDHFGYDCQVCGMNFLDRYGELGEGFIHVHHLTPLGESEGEHTVDPVKELRPVCPNCHAMLHRESPLVTIEDLQRIVLDRQAGFRH